MRTQPRAEPMQHYCRVIVSVWGQGLWSGDERAHSSHLVDRFVDRSYVSTVGAVEGKSDALFFVRHLTVGRVVSKCVRACSNDTTYSTP
jgi:hypothetical protein